MKAISYLSVLQLFILICFSSFGNNILVENVSLEGQVAAEHYVFIQFDLSWDNSWRTTTVPNNWDAAWIFCKYRVAGEDWHHVFLHPDGHVADYGSTIDVAPDSAGVFIYRDADGSGSNDWNGIKLRWDYGLQGVNDDALLEVKVYAIEMIYVTGGDFYLGDGNSVSRFIMGVVQSSSYPVNSEDAITVLGSGSNLWALSNIGAGTVPADYPKGYQGFYVMKYEMSQEEYVEFLNSLTRTQQNTRTATDISGTSTDTTFVVSHSMTLSYRNSIRCPSTLPASGPVNFFNDYNNDETGGGSNDGQNIACNFLTWPDMAAYLDWAALRPMTEMEFEKACRGPNNPVAGEFAWGNALIHQYGYALDLDGWPDEYIMALNPDAGNCNYSVTFSSTYRVLRCGIFAASSYNHTRMETGATYYGIMEMSGDAWEYVVNAVGNAGWSFTGLHGNGSLDATGNADVAHWPGINGNTSENTANGVYSTGGVTGYGGAGIKGGNGTMAATHITISARDYVVGMNFLVRQTMSGGRGCRTAP